MFLGISEAYYKQWSLHLQVFSNCDPESCNYKFFCGATVTIVWKLNLYLQVFCGATLTIVWHSNLHLQAFSVGQL